ncbi:MAG: transketolase [Zoogloeaceae bacterium]|nr:transketolase [Zoogloeaceae bacterium]
MSVNSPQIAFNPLTSALRVLAVDAIQKANSGHPGAPLGMAEIAEVLWRRHLRHDPAHPAWPNRDRFVLSNGHGSMLLYALLHLSGYDLSLAELQDFRQFGSRAAGHPEVGHPPGVETTTGPLGQGIANAVGFALAERVLGATFNRPGHTIIDYRTYAFMGDGCMMEGISHEVCSLAGTLGLGKLIVFYDDNGISIDGAVPGWFADDTPRRFAAYGWQVIPDVPGHDAEAINAALLAAQQETEKPTLIVCKTVIGMGSPNKAGSHDCHGSPLGAAEVAALRETIGWPHPPFVIPDEIRAAWDARTAGTQQYREWLRRLTAYRAAYPELAAEFERRVIDQALPDDWPEIRDAFLAAVRQEAPDCATRKASQNTIAAYLPRLPELFGGSADLASSNLTFVKGSTSVATHAAGNYCHYGVREFGMTAIANGIALTGGLIPYTATFLVFSDYARNAIRMAALMKLRQVLVHTHDSIGLGEDGPTHQPVEQLSSLRLIPNLDVWRPCDALETAVAWSAGIERQDGPTLLALSRQNLPCVTGAIDPALMRRGGYILSDVPEPVAILIATGSEVKLALDAQAALARKIPTRVVSMPSTSAFDRQDKAYRESVLGKHVLRVAIEAAHGDFWRKYVGLHGAVISIDTFGASAPAEQLFAHFGFTVEHVCAVVKKNLREKAGDPA